MRMYVIFSKELKTSFCFAYPIKVILESFSSVSQAQIERPTATTDSQLLVLSAKNGKSLQMAVERMKEYTAQMSCSMNDLAYTLGSRREHLAHRAFAIIDPDGKVSDFEK